MKTKSKKVSTPGKSRNLLEDQEKSWKFDIFQKKSGESKARKFLSMQIFNLKKNMHGEMCLVGPPHPPTPPPPIIEGRVGPSKN